jgi:hypothetical protein
MVHASEPVKNALKIPANGVIKKAYVSRRGILSWKTIPQGAATSVWAAIVAPADAVGAHFCEDCHVAEILDDPAIRGGVRSYALNPDRAKALWAKSEEMVGERF